MRSPLEFIRGRRYHFMSGMTGHRCTSIIYLGYLNQPVHEKGKPSLGAGWQFVLVEAFEDMRTGKAYGVGEVMHHPKTSGRDKMEELVHLASKCPNV